jgi:hypothetical protein
VDKCKASINENNAIIARREYMKQWRKKNPDKVKAAQARFFAKKALESQEGAESNAE